MILAGLLALLARAAILNISASAAVDHYYWLLAARAYRQSRSLPVRIVGKYLLEDERQVYPAFFGWLLSWIPEPWLQSAGARWYPQIVDAALLALVLAFAWTRGISADGFPLIVIVLGFAPIFAAYNTQLTSRAFGNFFLTLAVFCTAAALPLAPADPRAIALLCAAGLALAAVVLTHKMSSQLVAACWPVWALVEQDWRVFIIPVVGVALAALLTGAEFAKLQWRAHLQIVKFWHRHRDTLGAHAFNDSPVYGNGRGGTTLFHQPGIRGAVVHFVRAFSYNPFAWLLPLSLLWTSAPSDWLLVWTLGPLCFCLLTLYVPQMRCLGGGHLYMFNSVAPTAIWWAQVWTVSDWRTVTLFLLSAGAAVFALINAYRVRKAGSRVRDTSYRAALDHLSQLKPGRLAVFPLTAAEEAAFRTPHAVLWGGHGLGFPQLEPMYPVLRQSLSEIMSNHRCNLLLFDTRYWPEGSARLKQEIPDLESRAFGSWQFVSVHLSSNTKEVGSACVASPV